jgi:hypothetical protein
MDNSIFDEKFRYKKPDGCTLARRADAILEPLFKEYIDMGYSPREISHLLILSVMDVENEIILGF